MGAIKRVYSPYYDWEDYKAGMYRNPINLDIDSLVTKDLKLLGSDRFMSIGLEVLYSWRCATNFNLSNRTQNRKAWIGQAACCYNHGSVERITRQAWKHLDVDSQNRANLIAEKIIKRYEISYFRIHRGLE
jgi:hypothetical protein